MNVAATSAIMAANIAIMASKRKRARLRNIRRTRINKEIKTMPNELIREFIGKEVVIKTIEEVEYHGRLVAAEDNWVKVEEKRVTRLINSDSITAISYKHLNL
ncbi:MAG: hypothetical protein MJ241_03595 [Bacilli bacterium]|nr:hypothetical protein [Bacilli bacterium]